MLEEILTNVKSSFESTDKHWSRQMRNSIKLHYDTIQSALHTAYVLDDSTRVQYTHFEEFRLSC